MAGILVAKSLEQELREQAQIANGVIVNYTSGLRHPRAREALERIVEIITEIFDARNGGEPSIEVRQLIIAALNHREHVVTHIEREIPGEWEALVGHRPKEKVTLVTK